MLTNPTLLLYASHMSVNDIVKCDRCAKMLLVEEDDNYCPCCNQVLCNDCYGVNTEASICERCMVGDNE